MTRDARVQDREEAREEGEDENEPEAKLRVGVHPLDVRREAEVLLVPQVSVRADDHAAVAADTSPPRAHAAARLSSGPMSTRLRPARGLARRSSPHATPPRASGGRPGGHLARARATLRRFGLQNAVEVDDGVIHGRRPRGSAVRLEENRRGASAASRRSASCAARARRTVFPASIKWGAEGAVAQLARDCGSRFAAPPREAVDWEAAVRLSSGNNRTGEHMAPSSIRQMRHSVPPPETAEVTPSAPMPEGGLPSSFSSSMPLASASPSSAPWR